MQLEDLTKMLHDLPLKDPTRELMTKSLQLMTVTDSEPKANAEFTCLHGMLCTLQTEGIISIQDLDRVGSALSDLWRPIARGFIVARLGTGQPYAQ